MCKYDSGVYFAGFTSAVLYSCSPTWHELLLVWLSRSCRPTVLAKLIEVFSAAVCETVFRV